MQYWTTTSRPVGEQFSYWREVICQAFTPLATDRGTASGRPSAAEPGLASWVRSSLLTSTNCAEVSSKTQTISHGDAELRRTESEDVFMNLVTRGSCIVSQGGRTAHVKAGGFSFVDTTETYTQTYLEDEAHGEWRAVSFRIPRGHLVPLLAAPQRFTAVAHDGTAGGIASVAASTVLSTWGNVGRLGPAEADAAESALNVVLAAAAGASEALRDTGRESLESSLRASVNRYVAANLQSGADLSSSAVARRFRMSTRKLHAIYQGADLTYAQTVLAMRVTGCARDLAAGDRSSLSDLAARWGFSDLSPMNRVFRAHRGCLPSEYRAGRAGRAEARRAPSP